MGVGFRFWLGVSLKESYRRAGSLRACINTIVGILRYFSSISEMGANMTQDMVAEISLLDEGAAFQPAHAVENARQLALISFISPILYMASLVTAAVLLMSDLGRQSDVFRFWLTAQCLACAFLFLDSLREKAVLLDRDMIATSSLLKQFSFVTIGFCWGVIPSVLALYDRTAEMHLVFGAILSGTTLSATLLLWCMPKIGKTMLAVAVGGFLANTLFQPDLFSSIMSLAMLIYFGVLGFCSRWYYMRFNERLDAAEEVALRTQELKSVLKDIGHAADTYFWRTDTRGVVVEVSNGAALVKSLDRQVVGRHLIDQFAQSQERELLLSRFTRHSEVVALEIEVATPDNAPSRWWKLSARPVFEDKMFKGYRGAATDVSALHASETRAAFLTEYDSLTGLMNRASFYEAVQAKLNEPWRKAEETGILWVDLDNFKWINDTFGHAGGDDILRMVAARLEQSCESSDVICRFGGDEFAVLATRQREGDALRRFVGQFTEKMAAPYMLESSEVQCSASVGFRRFEHGEREASSLMKEADLALYSAKSGGRATWKEYSEAFKAKVRGQRDLARDLEKAIGTDEFQLEFQPIVDGRTQKVVAVEALSRWMHPTRGAISPTEFIAVAEHNGMIIDLGDTVVQSAIEAAVTLPDDVKVGINISPLQIHSTGLIELIRGKLEETGVNPARIELEITESVFLSDNAFVLDRLQQLKDLGVRIALDDFGTGFSSLSYLQRFPFDKLKLDQAFVRGIETSDQSCAIARATISMAHALNLTVTAEGVETQAQADFLIEQGCDELQGFLYAFPQAGSALAGYLDEADADHFRRRALFRDAKVITLDQRKAKSGQ